VTKRSMSEGMISLALGTLDNPQRLQFETESFTQETEITGHIVAHLNVKGTGSPAVPV
jgi:hypothetical protein